MSAPKPVESRSPQANWQHTQKAEGLCPKCPNKVDRNPRTGKPYYECLACRKVTAAEPSGNVASVSSGVALSTAKSGSIGDGVPNSACKPSFRPASVGAAQAFTAEIRLNRLEYLLGY